MNASELESLIKSGESGGLEFKATFRFDVDEQRKDRSLIRPAAKTISAFMNTDGGVLLIGVNDDHSIRGINEDLHTLTDPNLDAYERTLRGGLRKFLGTEAGPEIDIQFVKINDELVTVIECSVHHSPVYLRDGEKQEFYIRDGNASQPLGVSDAHSWIQTKWPGLGDEDPGIITSAVEDALRRLGVPTAEQLTALLNPTTSPPPREPRFPVWAQVSTRRVLELYLKPLASQAGGWKQLSIISPWISEFNPLNGYSFDQLLIRLQADNAIAYVVTRPPEESWHKDAVEKIIATGRANVAFVPHLHVKLYTADTKYGSFAVMGSANFTSQSLINRELALRVDEFGDGKKVVRSLRREAALIYRTPDRQLVAKANF